MGQPRARLQQARTTPAAVLACFGFYAAPADLDRCVRGFIAGVPDAAGLNILQQTSTIGIMAIGDRWSSWPAA
ncbi:MAG TPA: hypothetical protein VGM32_00375, partial [Rhodopila sp.]